MVSKIGIMVKLESIHDWAIPTSPIEFRSFIDLVGYYRQFTKSFANIAALMTRLTRKEIPFLWFEECKWSFGKINGFLTKASTLEFLIEGEKFIVYCDSFGVCLGCVLMQ